MRLIFFLYFIGFSSVFSKENPCDSIKKKVVPNVRTSSQSKEIPISININNSNDSHSNEDCCATNKKQSVTNADIEIESKFDYNKVIENAITIFLGLVAAFIALHQSKSNTISSSRIRWIEDLKTQLSELYSVTVDVISSNENFVLSKDKKDKERSEKYYMLYDANITKFNILVNKIKMQLNSSELEHQNIENALNDLDSKLCTHNIDKTTQAEVEKDLKIIIANSKIIFKKEWDKSKKLFKI